MSSASDSSPTADASAVLDRTVRWLVYRFFAETGRAPELRRLARLAEASPEDTAASLRRLHDAHAVVLHPGGPDREPRVWMAHPFSDVPTNYLVDTGEKRYDVPCVWDALSLPPMLGVAAEIHAKHPSSGDPMHLEIRGGELQPSTTLIHFVVPAAQFWDDIGRT